MVGQGISTLWYKCVSSSLIAWTITLPNQVREAYLTVQSLALRKYDYQLKLSGGRRGVERGKGRK